MSADRLTIEDLESLVPKLAYHIDHTPPGERELFLAKAFLYLAGLHGNIQDSMKSLDRAAHAGRVEGRGKR